MPILIYVIANYYIYLFVLDFAYLKVHFLVKCNYYGTCSNLLDLSSYFQLFY